MTVNRRDADFTFERGHARPELDPGRHPADEAGRHAAPVVSGRGRAGVHGRRRVSRRPRSRSPTPTSPSRAGSRPASRSTRRRRATAPSSSTSRWGPRAGSRRTTTRPTRRRSTRSSRCPTPRRRSASASSSSAPTTATARRRGTGRRTTRPPPTSRRRPSATSCYTRGVDGRDVDGAHAARVQRHRRTRDAAQLAAINASLAAAPDQINFLSDLFGPVPVRLHRRRRRPGGRRRLRPRGADQAALRRRFTSGNPSINIGTQLHELAHQWVGNSVTLETWDDIWFNEGWANWAEWYWQFASERRRRPGGDLRRPRTPARLPRTGRSRRPCSTATRPTCSCRFPTYDRGAMTIQGYREIVGDDVFFELRPGASSGASRTPTSRPTSSSTYAVRLARGFERQPS